MSVKFLFRFLVVFFFRVDIVLEMIGCGGCGMSERTHANGRFLFVHQGSVVDAISVDCGEGRLMASLGIVRRRSDVNGD